uniref:LIM zinc-binding domain-containing protein n=1 Tax=Gasterosteus aculeatus aculeatus TaxID=481459 RepID=A0AAQ4RMN6_GASAC
MGDMGDPPKKKRLISLCVGCGNQIHDQYILRVSPDLEWHAACLKCAECSQYLDESCTCFVRDGKTYCKRDYISRTHLGPAARAPAPRPQAAGEDHARAHGAQREAAAHAADLLQRQPAARRAHEGAAGGDDGPQPARHTRVVPEQAVQGQEAQHPDEAAAAAAAQRQDEHPGNDGHPDGGGQSGAARRRPAGQPGGGAELPAALEGAQRLRPAERHRPAGLPATGQLLGRRTGFQLDGQRGRLHVVPASRHAEQHGVQPHRGLEPRPPPPRRPAPRSRSDTVKTIMGFYRARPHPEEVRARKETD